MTTQIAGPIRYTFDDVTTPMPSRVGELNPYIRLVRALAGAGIEPPPAWSQLVERLGRLRQVAIADGHRMQTRLTETVLHGGDADLELLWAGALAEHTPAAAENVLAPLYADALAELHRIYAPHAATNYGIVADRFNAAAKAFTRAAHVIDPGASADVVLHADPKALQAWRDAETHAAELDSMLEPLAAAAELVRGVGSPIGFGVNRDPFLIPLVCEADGVHRRVAWAAWNDQPEPPPVTGALTLETLEPQPKHIATRCGRWARMLRAGAAIRAVEDPIGLELTPYPRPYGVKLVTPPGGSANNPKKQVWARFDPEDETAKPRSPLARLRAFGRRHNIETDDVDLLGTVADSGDGN